MRKSLLAVVFAAVAVLIMAPSQAMATTFDLNQIPGGCCVTIAHPSAGTITLAQNGTSVNVTVALNSGFGFIDTGSHDSFTFNLSNSAWTPIITFTGATATGWTSGQPGSNSTFGSFGVFVDCNVPGTCGNGGSNPYYGTLTRKMLRP